MKTRARQTKQRRGRRARSANRSITAGGITVIKNSVFILSPSVVEEVVVVKIDDDFFFGLTTRTGNGEAGEEGEDPSPKENRPNLRGKSLYASLGLEVFL